MVDLNNFNKKVEEFVFYSDDIAGNKFYYQLKKEGLLSKIEADEERKNYLKILQFLIIPFLDLAEIENLFKNYLDIGLKVEGLDINDKINKALIMLDLADRDGFKSALKKALENSSAVITTPVLSESGSKLSIASDWVKDYVANIEKNKKNTLEEAQYFNGKSYVIGLKEIDKSILKKFFSLYKLTTISSFTPEGFEDDVLIKTADGKLITMQKGKVVILYDYTKNINKDNKKNKIEDFNKIKKTIEKTKIPEIITSVLPAKEEDNKVVELRAMAEQFSVGSLERRAIEEEIRKVENE